MHETTRAIVVAMNILSTRLRKAACGSYRHVTYSDDFVSLSLSVAPDNFIDSVSRPWYLSLQPAVELLRFGTRDMGARVNWVCDLTASSPLDSSSPPTHACGVAGAVLRASLNAGC